MGIERRSTLVQGKILAFDAVAIDDERFVTAVVGATSMRVKLIVWRLHANGGLERLADSYQSEAGIPVLGAPAVTFAGEHDFGVTGEGTRPTVALAYTVFAGLSDVHTEVSLVGVGSSGFHFLTEGPAHIDPATLLAWGTSGGLSVTDRPCLAAKNLPDNRLRIYQFRVAGHEGQFAGPDFKGITMTVAGQVKLLAAAGQDNGTFVTMTTGSTRAKLIKWKPNPAELGGKPVRLQDSGEQMGNAHQVAVAARGTGYITAVKTVGPAENDKDRLKVHSWNSDLVRLAASPIGPLVDEVDVASRSGNHAVTAAINSSDKLDLRSWNVSENKISQLDELVADDDVINQVKILAVKGRYVTVVRTGGTRLKLISWDI